MKKKIRAYLFTRTATPAKALRVRTRVEIDKKIFFAVFPLLVKNFSDYFNSNGTLRDGFKATSFREKYESSCVQAAYQAACRTAEYMVNVHPDFWRYATSAYFSELANREFGDICDGLNEKECYISMLKKSDKEREEANRVPLWRETLSVWPTKKLK